MSISRFRARLGAELPATPKVFRFANVSRVAFVLLVSAGLLGCPRPSRVREGCGKDTDCKGQRVCVSGECVEPPAGSVPAAPGSSKPHAGRAAARPQGPGPYAMFGGNAQHTGRTAGKAPAKKPKQAWSVRAGGPIVGSPTVGPDGTIYVTSHDRSLYAVSPAGKVRWKLTARDRMWSTPAVAQDGTVYVGSDDDHLYAVNGKTGKLVWKLRIGECKNPMGFGPVGSRCDVDGGPTIGPDGTIYTGGDGIYAVWPDGKLRWKVATSEHVIAAPALATDGTVYAGCLDDTLYAVRSDGTTAWSYRTGGDIESTPTVGADGTVYVGSDDDAMYAINPNGTLEWKVITGNDVRSSAAIAADGTIYFGSHDGRLYAVKPNGEVSWRFATADRVQSSPSIAADGAILFGSQDDHVYALDRSGALRWYVTFDGDVDTSPAVSTDGVVYVGSDDGTLRAFR